MKCFIAMAFGRADTDKVYDDLICSVLRERGIMSLRVDRIEHNQNIDDRMMSELRSVDFVIADLTYARPSVYFEAGFAERQVPVIYTIRRDHLGQKVDDEFGNFRIHFDLLMRNVIDWSDPTDPLFTGRLGRRIDEVLIPIREKYEKATVQTRQRERFMSLSSIEQIKEVQDAVRSVFRQSRIGIESLSAPELYDYDPVGGKLCGSILYWFRFSLVADASAADSRLGRCLFSAGSINFNCGRNVNDLKLIRTYYIASSLTHIPSEEVRKALLDYRQEANQFSRTFEQKVDVPFLPYAEDGQVFYPVTGNTNIFGQGIKRGAAVTKPPQHLASSTANGRHSGSGLRVITCNVRQVPLVQTAVYLTDKMQSIEEFTIALAAIVSAALS